MDTWYVRGKSGLVVDLTACTMKNPWMASYTLVMGIGDVMFETDISVSGDCINDNAH